MQFKSATMLLLIRPILFRFLQSEGVKKLVVDLLTAYSESTESQIDDQSGLLVVSFMYPEKRVEK